MPQTPKRQRSHEAAMSAADSIAARRTEDDELHPVPQQHSLNEIPVSPERRAPCEDHVILSTDANAAPASPAGNRARFM